MRLMCSRNQDEVEVVKNELLKAGIATETRRDPTAEAMGVNAVELWVKPQGQASGPDQPNAEQHSSAHADANGVDSRHTNEPRREELKHASSLLEKGITEMFRRESELAGECASLRRKLEELNRALAQGQAALARELDSRAAAEKSQAEKISGLASALERERNEWRQQWKSREDALKNAQEKLGSMSRQLQTQQAAALALKEQIVSLEMQRDEHEISLCNARTEALAEREARIAAEERAQRAELALQKQLVTHTELEQQMQAHLASLNSLFGRMDRKGAAGPGKP